MIETASPDARNACMALMSEDSELCLDDARFCLEKSDRVIVCKRDGIVGCGTLRLWGQARGKADAYLYVKPEARGVGVGGALLKALMDTSNGSALEFISAKVETNHAQSLAFYHSAGYAPWYTELLLCHSGERQPESGLELENYQAEHFEAYVDALRSSFYELRRSNDFQPYLCCEPDAAKRSELELNKNDIFVLLDHGRLVASVKICADFIEDVFVAPDCQGRGIGKKLMRFAVNRVIDSGSGRARLSAIEWNARALRLYQSVGFQVVKKTHYLRLFLNERAGKREEASW